MAAVPLTRSRAVALKAQQLASTEEPIYRARSELVSTIRAKIGGGWKLSPDEFQVAQEEGFWPTSMTYDNFLLICYAITPNFQGQCGYLCTRVAASDRVDLPGNGYSEKVCAWGLHACDVNPAKLTTAQIQVSAGLLL